MKVIVLIENTSICSLCAEHGLSVYIEYNGMKYLLDTGASDTFSANAHQLGINLADIDIAFLSHAHYDHAGGFETFFKENEKAPVYLQDTSAENCYYRPDNTDRYIGIPTHLLKTYKKRFQYIDHVCEVEKGVWLIPHFTKNLDEMGRRACMYRKIGDEYVPDDFAHEQSLVFETPKGLILLNSCSHGGIVNIVKEVQMALGNQKVYAVIGGFHMMKLSSLDTLAIPETEVIDVAPQLQNLGVDEIYTGHCTGTIAYGLLKKELDEKIHELSTGTIIEF